MVSSCQMPKAACEESWLPFTSNIQPLLFLLFLSLPCGKDFLKLFCMVCNILNSLFVWGSTEGFTLTIGYYQRYPGHWNLHWVMSLLVTFSTYLAVLSLLNIAIPCWEMGFSCSTELRWSKCPNCWFIMWAMLWNCELCSAANEHMQRGFCLVYYWAVVF